MDFRKFSFFPNIGNARLDLQRVSSEKDNVEVLWRLAVCCNELAGRFEKKDRRKEKIIEGRQYALQAYNVSL